MGKNNRLRSGSTSVPCSTDTVTVSCSECKLELNRKRWTQLLMHWLGNCVNSDMQTDYISPEWLIEIVNRYMDDICENDIEKTLLRSEDLEPYLKYKYPILILRFFTEEADQPRKYFIMASVLLYHCCVNSKTGTIEEDILRNLADYEQELILKYCESLKEMEITVNNVERAIGVACEAVLSKRKSGLITSKHQFANAKDSNATTAPTVSQGSGSGGSKKSPPTLKSTDTSSFSKTSFAPNSSDTSGHCSVKMRSKREVKEESVDEMTVFNMQGKEVIDDCGFGSSLVSSLGVENNMVHIGDDYSLCRTLVKQPEPCKCIRGSVCCDESDCLKCSDSVEMIKIDNKEKNREKRTKKRKKKSNKGGIEIDCNQNRNIEEDCNVYRFSKRGKKEDAKPHRRNHRGADSFGILGGEIMGRSALGTLDDTGWRNYNDWFDGGAPMLFSNNLNGSKDSKSKSSPRQGRRARNEEKETRRVSVVVRQRSIDLVKDRRRHMFIIFCKIFWVMALVAAVVGTIVYFVLQYTTPSAKLKLIETTLDDPDATTKIIPLHAMKKAESEESLRLTQAPKHFEGSQENQTLWIWIWRCMDSVCVKVFEADNNTDVYPALSTCVLVCGGPQLWPRPIGITEYSKQIVYLATSSLAYKFNVSSDNVNQYLAEAFKLFIGDLAKQEGLEALKRQKEKDYKIVKKMHIHMEVESDPDPRLRLNTDESYDLKIESFYDTVRINVTSPSFCGVRHGLETLSQLILVDQVTGHLITLSHVHIKDAPSYKYRGLMLDTARHFISLPAILRTIDGMASCKMNTFHWRITDSASFPLLLPTLSNLFEYGGYDRAQVYTKEDVKTVVKRAGVRGIRVLIEVALPGPIGRAWSWSDDATCPKKNDNVTCDNILCVRLKMQDSVFEIIQHIYSEILDLTGVDDVFHMSHGVFSLSNCYFMIDERKGYLERALERLKIANKGFLPKLPIVWYTPHLVKDIEDGLWERFGLQIFEWPTYQDSFLSKYRAIHSCKWDLSCEIKNQRCTRYRSWQEMYSWRSWRTLEAFSVEGGEALLWTDLVDESNLDFHLWPRTMAVAERLWSDISINSTVTDDTYIRLDGHRWRMLLRGIKVEPVWPVWCTFNPNFCLAKLHRWLNKNKKK